MRALANRALDEYSARTRLLRGRTQIVMDGTTLEAPPPADMIEPIVLIDENGKAIDRVARTFTLSWEGRTVWHWEPGRLVIGEVYKDTLRPKAATYTLEYVRRAQQLTGDPDQQVDLPDDLIAAIESRVLEHFSVSIPELLRFHHARWRDLVHQGRIRANMMGHVQPKLTRLPEL